MRHYLEEEYLMLSGIQHFIFCRRQWALIHVEQQWEENYRTVDGKIMHCHAHDGDFFEKRGELLITRGMAVSSAELGISGMCDVVEFRKDENGIKLHGYEGNYNVIPIEYKRGKPKENLSDKLQLTAQALCLEEMLCCEVQEGFLYYGETRHRMKVIIDTHLRNLTKKTFEEMHQYYERGYTPKAKRTRSCNACSLKDICLPGMEKGTASAYIKGLLEEEENFEEIT